jgi:hypothetical protein
VTRQLAGIVGLELEVNFAHRLRSGIFIENNCSELSFLGLGETVHLVHRPLTSLLYQPRRIDYECGAVGGMRIGRGNQSAIVPVLDDR